MTVLKFHFIDPLSLFRTHAETFWVKLHRFKKKCDEGFDVLVLLICFFFIPTRKIESAFFLVKFLKQYNIRGLTRNVLIVMMLSAFR